MNPSPAAVVLLPESPGTAGTQHPYENPQSIRQPYRTGQGMQQRPPVPGCKASIRRKPAHHRRCPRQCRSVLPPARSQTRQRSLPGYRSKAGRIPVPRSPAESIPRRRSHSARCIPRRQGERQSAPLRQSMPPPQPALPCTDTVPDPPGRCLRSQKTIRRKY